MHGGVWWNTSSWCSLNLQSWFLVLSSLASVRPCTVLSGVCASLHRPSSSASVRPLWPLFVLAPSVLVSIRLAAGLLRWLGDLPAVDGVNTRCPLGYLRNGMRRQNGARHRLEFQCFLLKSFLSTQVGSLQRERERISFLQ